MSWTAEAWKDGLSSRALQKVSEYEKQLEKLSKEKQQKQLQLEALETMLHKQKQKLDEGRSELASVTQEKQSLAEVCTSAERTQQRLTQEMKVKDAQVCSLQGQLSAAKKEISNLEQELKRCLAELEKLENLQRLGKLTSPCSSNSSPLHIGEEVNLTSPSRVRENIIVINRPIAPLDSPAPSCFVQLPYSRSSSPLGSPQCKGSPGFPWQEEPFAIQSATTAQRGSKALQIPWGQDPLPLHSTIIPLPQNGSGSCIEVTTKRELVTTEQPLRRENEDLRRAMSQLQSQVQAHQEGDRVLSQKCRDLQRQFDEARSALAAQEKKSSKCQEELQRMTMTQQQTEAKHISLQEKLKHLSEDLKCQRQNSEATKHNLEQKMKQKEKEHQLDLAAHHQQNLALEQQHLQESNRLRQELQQAKSNVQALQAQAEKLMTQHQSREKELKEAAQRAEQEIYSIRSKMEQLQADLEAVKGQGQVPGPPIVTSPCMKWSTCEEETKRLMPKCGHRSAGHRTDSQVLHSEEGLSDISNEIISVCRENICPSKAKTLQNESGNLLAVSNKVVNCPVETKVPVTVHMPETRTSLMAPKDCDTLHPTPKKPRFSVCSEVSGPLRTEEQTSPVQHSETLSQSQRGADTEVLSDTDGKGQYVPADKNRSDIFRTENEALLSELTEVRLKLLEVKEESELRHKALSETCWKMKQTNKKYADETNRLKKQLLELNDKLSGLELDLENERGRSVGHQQDCQTLKEKCGRLSTLLESKEVLINQKEAEKKRQQINQQEPGVVLCMVKGGEERAMLENRNIVETAEEIDILEREDTMEGEECGSDHLITNNNFSNLSEVKEHVLFSERIYCSEEPLNGAVHNNKALQDVEEVNESKQVVSQESGDPTLEAEEQKVKDLQAQCDILYSERLESEAKAIKLQDKLSCLQTTIDLQTQQLTLAFEMQTKNIDDLLHSLEEKEAHITTLNETLRRYRQSMAMLQAENAKLLAAQHHKSSEHSGQPIRELGVSTPAGLEYAILSTKQSTLDSNGHLNEIESSQSEMQNCTLATRTGTVGGISLLDSKLDAWKDPLHHLDYLQGFGELQTEKQSEVARQIGDGEEDMTTSRISLGKEICGLKDPATSIKQWFLASSPGGVQMVENVLEGFTDKYVEPSQIPSEQDRSTACLQLQESLEQCSQLEHEHGTLNENVLDVTTSSASPEDDGDCVELLLNKPERVWQNGLEDTLSSVNGLCKDETVLSPKDVTEAKIGVQAGHQEVWHWNVLQNLCISFQAALAKAQQSEHAGGPSSAYAVLQHQVDIMNTMVWDLLEERSPVPGRSKAYSWGGRGDQAPGVNQKTLLLKMEHLEGKDSETTSQDMLKCDSKLLHMDAERLRFDQGVTYSGQYIATNRPLPTGGQADWVKVDGRITSSDMHELASKVVVEKAWFFEIGDTVRTIQGSHEVAAIPQSVVGDAWGRGCEMHSRQTLTDGETTIAKSLGLQGTQMDRDIIHSHWLSTGGTHVSSQTTNAQSQGSETTHLEPQAFSVVCSETDPWQKLSKRTSEPQSQKKWQEMERLQELKGLPERQSAEPWLQKRLSEKEGQSEPLVQESMPNSEKLSDTKGMVYLSERNRQSEPQEQTQGESQGVMEHSDQEALSLAQKQFKIRTINNLLESEGHSEPLVQMGSPEKKPLPECLIHERLSEMENPSLNGVLDPQPDRQSSSECLALKTLSNTKRNSETKRITSLTETKIQSSSQVQDRLKEVRMPSDTLVQENLLENEGPSGPQAQEGLQERQTPTEPKVQERLHQRERLFKSQVPENLTNSEEQFEFQVERQLSESKQPSDLKINKMVPEPTTLCKLMVYTKVQARERETEPQIYKSLPENNTSPVPQAQDSLSQSENLYKVKVLTDDGRHSRQGIQERPLDIEKPSAYQNQETFQEADKLYEHQEQERLSTEKTPDCHDNNRLAETSKLSEYQQQERLSKAGRPYESDFNECVLETVSTSKIHINERVPENKNQTENLGPRSLPETENPCGTKEQRSLAEEKAQFHEEMESVSKMVAERGPVAENKPSVTESRICELSTSLMKQSQQPHEVMDKAVRLYTERGIGSELQLQRGGATLLLSSHEDQENGSQGKPESPGKSILGAELLCPKGQSLDPDDTFNQHYTRLVEEYHTLEDTNCSLSQTLAAFQRELEALRKAVRPEVRHSETQTEILDKTRDVEVQEAKAWTWHGSPTDLAQRLQRQREKMSVAYDDTEYEPYGLPEVVMKGFADIPTGPACPYVLRRGLLGSAVAAMKKQSSETGTQVSSKGSSV